MQYILFSNTCSASSKSSPVIASLQCVLPGYYKRCWISPSLVRKGENLFCVWSVCILWSPLRNSLSCRLVITPLTWRVSGIPQSLLRWVFELCIYLSVYLMCVHCQVRRLQKRRPEAGRSWFVLHPVAGQHISSCTTCTHEHNSVFLLSDASCWGLAGQHDLYSSHLCHLGISTEAIPVDWSIKFGSYENVVPFQVMTHAVFLHLVIYI